MTKDTILKLELEPCLRHVATILKLVNSLNVFQLGVLEYIIVSLDSFEYPINFIVLETKAMLVGYPLILGTPWLAIIDTYIRRRIEDMAIANDPSKNKMTLYPPAKPLFDT